VASGKTAISEHVSIIIKHLTSEKTEKKVERLSNLSHLYNLFQDLSIKFNILVAILDYARESDQTHAIECLFDTIDVRLNELAVSTSQKRDIYGLILKNIEDIKYWQITYVYDYWVKYFSSFDENEQVPIEIFDHAVNAIILILKDQEILFTEQLFSTKTIQALSSQKGDKYRFAYRLLELYTGMNFADFKIFKSTPKVDSFLQNSGLNVDDLAYKMRLLNLNTLACQQSVLSYELIAKTLEINENEVELYVIDTTSSGILDARIDQLNQRIIIKNAPSRQFDKKRWQSLDEKLDKWKDNMAHLLNTYVRLK
jgi:translation initiation factor 3 subunit M